MSSSDDDYEPAHDLAASLSASDFLRDEPRVEPRGKKAMKASQAAQLQQLKSQMETMMRMMQQVCGQFLAIVRVAETLPEVEATKAGLCDFRQAMVGVSLPLLRQIASGSFQLDTVRAQ